MDYVVNPNLIYWLQVIDGVRALVITSLVVSSICLVIFCILYFISDAKSVWWKDSDDDCKRRKDLFRPMFKLSIIITISMSLVASFIPSSKTLIAMEVAKNVTYTNIDKAKQEVKGAIDYIFSKIKGEVTNK